MRLRAGYDWGVLRFLHTADLHLGKGFHRRGAACRERLRQARFDAVRRVGELATEHGAQFVLIAGDLFDSNSADDRTVVQGCEALRSLPVPVFAISGNHDAHEGPGSVWRRRPFMEEAEGWSGFEVLEPGLREAVFLKDWNVSLHAASLAERHPQRDPLASWQTRARGDTFRIGLAHGSVHGFGETSSNGSDRATAVPLGVERVAGSLDYLALGDWHSAGEVGERAWYSGTPEGTSHNEREPGQVLMVEVGEPGAEPSVTPLGSGRTCWHRHTVELHRAEDVDALAAWFDGLDRPTDTLVRLEWSGSLPLGERLRAQGLIKRQRDRLMEMDLRGPGPMPRPEPGELDALAGGGYVGAALADLRTQAEGGGPASEQAAWALGLLAGMLGDGVGGRSGGTDAAA